MGHEWYIPTIVHPYEENGESEDWLPAIQLRYSPPDKHGEREEDPLGLGFSQISFLTVRTLLDDRMLDFQTILADGEIYIDTSIPITGPGAFGITIVFKKTFVL